MEQTAPGRYVGTFPAREPGSYFRDGQPGRAAWRRCAPGVNVPYSDEFRDRATNDALLAQLAAVAPKGGAPGQLIERRRPSPGPTGPAAGVNTFRHDLPKATSSQDIWH